MISFYDFCQLSFYTNILSISLKENILSTNLLL